MHKTLSILIIIITVLSCSDNAVFDTYKPVSKTGWHKDSIVNFNFDALDTISKNNIYINLRNNNDYQFSNLFLIVGIDFPDNNKVVDTLEYEMTNAEGKFLGNGFTDLKENKLEFKTNVVFPIKGNYGFTIQHAMRKGGEVEGLEVLEGISDVGLRIEKTKTND